MLMEPRLPQHLYVHVPFCRLVCAYCDFVTVGGRGEEIPRYVDALVAELGTRPASGELQTIYFGGGTPSLLGGAQMERVMEAALAHWPVVRLEEVTLEANPSERERPDWGALRAAGFDRISLGVQSLRDPDLRALARGHTAREAREAYAEVRTAGFTNVNIDLIYGIPGQSLSDWRGVLAEAVALGPDHLSLYALQLALAPDEWAAPPRPGALRWRARLASVQDEELAAEQYRAAEGVLADAGYEHYELSSWARPGRASRHNGAYWARHSYVGIGAGAHSYDGVDERSWNTRDLDAYLEAVEAGNPPVDGAETLDETTRAFEAIALGLRRVDGLYRAGFADEFGADPAARYAAAVEGTVGDGLLELSGDAMRLTATGRLLANEVLVAFAPVAAGSTAEVPRG
jgi:oxygen-independent coproporphyrinogen-3 oxidase